MRTVELAKVAVAAEALRLRRIARRQAMRGAYGAGAAVFGIAVLIVLHIVIYQILRIWLSPLVSSILVLVLDGAIAGVLGYLALQNTPDSVELEARQIKAQAIAEMKRSLTLMTMAAEVGGLVLRNRTRTGMKRGMAQVAAEMVSRLVGR